MIVQVPGVGNVEFPDGTDPSVIENALAQFKTGGVSELSTAFQQATTPQAGPPMPPEMLMRNKAKN